MSAGTGFNQNTGSGGGGGGVQSVNSGVDITVDNTDPANPIVNFTGTYQDPITVVANYSALPAVGTVTGEFYWCSASQGTSWLPGSLGGTYYSAGLYYSNGVTWEFMDVPYQATQSEVNTGTNTDKFVTPATLTNWTGRYWSKSGSIVELTTASDQLELQGPVAGATGTLHIKAGDVVNQYIVLSEAAASPNSAFLTFKSSGGNAIAMGARFSAGAPLSYVFTDPGGVDLLTINSTTAALTTTSISATTASNDILQTFINNSSGTPAANYGLSRLIQLKSSTTDSQTAGKEIFYWTTATHATRHSGYKLQLVGHVNIFGDVLQDVFSVDDNGNSFKVNIIAHAGYGPKLNLVSGTTAVADIQTSGANGDLYISSYTNTSTSIYFRPGNGSTMVRLNPTGMFIGGSTAPSATLHVVAVTEQQRIGYDSSNYFSTTIGSGGQVQFDATGASACFNFGNKTTTSQRLVRIGQDTAWADFGSWTADTSGFYIAGNQTTPGTQNYHVLLYTNDLYLRAPGGTLYLNSSMGGQCSLTLNSTGGSIAQGGALTPSNAIWQIRGTTEQQRIEYDSSNYFSTTVNNAGAVTFDAVGSGAGFTFSDNIINGALLRLKGYTVAGLPAGTVGDTAYVTDALAPVALANVAGGGAVTVKVFYDGANWIVQ